MARRSAPLEGAGEGSARGPTRRELLRGATALGLSVALEGCRPRQTHAAPIGVERGVGRGPVIVLGAGLAGLSAAYELMLSGHDVRVVEARQRPGGRVETLRKPFEQGLYAEAGGTYIPSVHELPAHYAKLFGLDLDPLTPPQLRDLGPCLHLRGKRYCDKRAPLPFELTPDERRFRPSELFDKLVTDHTTSLGDPDKVPLTEVLRAADRESVVEYLRRVGASAGAIELLTRTHLWPWGDLDGVSALLVLRDAVHFKDAAGYSVLRGGSERLPLAFAARLGDRISYETVVERIEQDAKGVRVGIRRGGTLSTIEGARAICALPFSLLSRVAFSPGLRPEKRRAINELPYVSITRVYLETRERFWEREGMSGTINTDLPFTHLDPMTMNQPGTHGIIEAHVPGANARRLMALAPEARVREVRDQVAQVLPKLPDQFIRGTSKCWDEDPWARGAYTYFKPGQMASLLPHLATPEGKIHFAGEHISAFQGWMQGALASGQRAAAEIRALSR